MSNTTKKPLKNIGVLGYIALIALPYLTILIQMLWAKGGPFADTGISEALEVFGTIWIGFFPTPTIGIAIQTVLVIFAWIMIFMQFGRGEHSTRFLFWNLVIKLCYIPFFILVFCVALVTSFFPLVPLFSYPSLFVLDLLFLIAPVPAALCGAIRLSKEESTQSTLAVVMMFFQFFFILDVIGAIVLYSAARSSRKALDSKNAEQDATKKRPHGANGGAEKGI